MDNNAQPQPIKFSNEFTQEIEKYIEIYKKSQKVPTVEGFAKRIGTDVTSLWAWANKPKKDDKGNILKELARPNFHAALKKLEIVSQELEQKQEEKLNPKQELFCQLYSTDREFFGNGVQTYIEVYEPNQKNPNWYSNACRSASEILSNPKVFNRVNELLDEQGLNDVYVDKQLLFVISQHGDITGKIAGIREYNKLRQRITDKIDHTTKGQSIIPISQLPINVPTDDSNK